MKKLFSFFTIAISSFSLGGCFFHDKFDWQDVVSGEVFFYTDGIREYYIDFSYSGEYYEKGIIESRGDSFYYTDEVEYIDSYSVWFHSRYSRDDHFIIYEDGRVYFVNIDVEWRDGYTKEQIDLLSIEDMILLTPK